MVHWSVASAGADHPESKMHHEKHSAAAVFGLLGCYAVSEGGAEADSLPTLGWLVAAGY